MRVLVFDPFRGAAGDMVCGALLHLGADADLVTRAMRSAVADPEVRMVERAGIRAIKVDTRAPVLHRTLDQVLERVGEADAPPEALEIARRVFSRIARAEEEIHGVSAHFHDVGADDAIADIVGACTAFHSLRPDGVAVGPVSLGGGSVSGPHGIYPVPAPATMAILRESGLTVRYGCAEDGELCTPTGAALLAEFSASGDPGPLTGTLLAMGYGAGDRDPPCIPNILRVTLLERGDAMKGDAVDILETNVDDVTGEVLASAMARLMDSGARDVCAIPCSMKKGRSGHLIRVICDPERSGDLASAMAVEMGTLGVRCVPCVHRFIAERDLIHVRVRIGGHEREIPVKCGKIGETVFTLKPEFGPVQEWADTLGLPARKVARIVEEEAWKVLGQDNPL
ncbi:MAG: nickel pincer cofactor biosynthesis protein LarC [Methanolinea sp.]|nr:nickel pincer cofactor biosynthesis protein LarC [Methanolinea sp.]